MLAASFQDYILYQPQAKFAFFSLNFSACSQNASQKNNKSSIKRLANGNERRIFFHGRSTYLTSFLRPSCVYHTCYSLTYLLTKASQNYFLCLCCFKFPSECVYIQKNYFRFRLLTILFHLWQFSYVFIFIQKYIFCPSCGC